ncbi:hypothetical protein HN873_049234 [Arachis hypogaea]
MRSPHPSNALSVKKSYPSNVTLRSQETTTAGVGVSTSAALIVFSSGAAKPSLEACHGGLYRCRNTLCLVCIANNANTRLLDFRSSCQMDLICLARWPRFQLGFRVHPWKPRPRIIVLFMIGFWMLDMSINMIQVPCRGFFGDLAASDQRKI